MCVCVVSLNSRREREDLGRRRKRRMGPEDEVDHGERGHGGWELWAKATESGQASREREDLHEG